MNKYTTQTTLKKRFFSFLSQLQTNSLSLLILLVIGTGFVSSFRYPFATFPQTQMGQLDDQLIDGRFTIGYGKKSLLFGYPYSFSSSHFVLQSSGKFASNNPNFSQTKALKGVLIAEAGSHELSSSKVIYAYDNLLITQTLRLVDENLQEIEDSGRGSFFEIDYEIENQSDTKRDIEFTLLLDPMINGDDVCKISADGSIIGLDKKFTHSNMPFHLTFFDGDLQSRLITKHEGMTSPDLVYVGQWAHLTNVLHLDQQNIGRYTDDSAVLIRWNSNPLQKGETRSFKVYFGVPKAKAPLYVQHHHLERSQQITLYFAPNQSIVTATEEQRLRDFLGAKRFKAALVEGYTDATGSEQVNLKLSKDRIDNVSYLLQMAGFKYEAILRKSHGEFFARNDEQTRSLGNENDRKVVVTVWR